MTKIDTMEVYAVEGPSVQYTGEDGWPSAVIMPLVLAGTSKGVFQLPNKLRKVYDDDGFAAMALHFDLDKAKSIASQARRRGYINSENWVGPMKEEEVTEYLRGTYHA